MTEKIPNGEYEKAPLNDQSEKIPNGNSEIDKFLPPDGAINGTKHIYKMEPLNDAEMGDFDPFKARIVEHPVSDCGTVTHLLKASLGTGILSMPAAFKSSGLIFGIFLTIVVSAICTHCAYVLVDCAHELYRRARKTKLSYADVAEEACRRGPKWARRYAPYAKSIVEWGIFITYFATCSCYTVIMAKNFNYVIYYYMRNTTESPIANLSLTNVTGITNETSLLKNVTAVTEEVPFDERITIALLLVPIILLAYVPNLKYLAPVSMVANVLMAIGLGITFYYLATGLQSISAVETMPTSISELPVAISIVIFAIEAIGVVMPLENNMEKPKHFTGICGVLNSGMSGVTLVYIILGFFGYLCYGEATEGSVTHNLPKEDIAAQIVNIVIGLAVFCTFGLQFYVCIDIAWNRIKDRYQKNEKLANYIMRTVMTIVCVLLAIAVPQIIPFVGLIGAFCFSFLGLMFPIFIEIITYWDKGFGKFNWKIYKDICVIFTGVLALIFGSKSAIESIFNP